MVFKFLLLWVVILAIAYGYIFVAGKHYRKGVNGLLKRVAISGVISGVVIALVMVINNFSGV